MSHFNYDERTFSDLYKDVNGFRPRDHEFYSASPERKQEIWDFYIQRLGEELRREREWTRRAMIDWERRILDARDYGAPSRKDAIRWLVSQDEWYYQDPEAICYEFGLPYWGAHRQEIEAVMR